MQQKDACVQTDAEMNLTTTPTQIQTAVTLHKEPHSNKDSQINFEDKENMNLTKKRKLNNNTAQLSEIVNVAKQKSSMKTTENRKRSSSGSSAPPPKCDPVQPSSQPKQTPASQSNEFVVSDECVDLIRHYIEHNKVGVDLYQFDSNQEYQKAVLYR